MFGATMWHIVFLFIFFTMIGANTTNTKKDIAYFKDCAIQPNCLNCGPKGCIKCPVLIVYPTRKCVNVCPFGYTSQWSTMVDFMGKVCTHNGNFLGLSAIGLTLLTGFVAGIVLCFVAISIAIGYVKYRRKLYLQHTLDSNSESDDKQPETKDFLKQLETLRPYSETYLNMLNDSRQQIRQLHREGDNSAISAYKPVVRDLAKILLLLNRPVERLTAVPDDWEHLFNWAEKTLKRYKRMSDSSQPQVAQLITFLQSPIVSRDLDEPAAAAAQYSVRGSTTMSTFKPDQIYGSSLSLQNAATVKSFSSSYGTYPSAINPEWKFEYSLVGHPVPPASEFDPAAWKSSKEFLSGPLFLEDDFYQLGFRPQDEITTEL